MNTYRKSIAFNQLFAFLKGVDLEKDRWENMVSSGQPFTACMPLKLDVNIVFTSIC